MIPLGGVSATLQSKPGRRINEEATTSLQDVRLLAIPREEMPRKFR